MSELYQIRADFDRTTIVVYQAYNDAIADAALTAQRFVPPFSMTRMTWLKPSFLWLMHRSHWGKKSGQTRTLAIRLKRSAWDQALTQGVLTHPEPSIHGDAWHDAFDQAQVHVQWDPERSLRGQALNHYSIQVGIGRHLIGEFASDWIVGIEDRSPQVAKIERMLRAKGRKNLARHLPPERPYPMPEEARRRLCLS